MAAIDSDELLTTREAAALCRMSKITLEMWRPKRKGPPFIKLGDGPRAAVRYSRSKLNEWLATRSRGEESTHDKSASLGEPDVPQLAMSVEQAAEASGICRSAIYTAMRDGKLLARKSGSRTVILHSDLAKYLETLPVREVSR